MIGREKVVLITDYAWPGLEPEGDLFSKIGAKIFPAETGTIDDLITLAS
jgi:hypothetical protein